MADPYVVHLHDDLDRELSALETAALRNPTGPEAKQYEAMWDGLDALAEGREAEFGGRRFNSLQEQYGELGAVAFEPRKDGRPFEVTAPRLERDVGKSLAGLDAAKAAEVQRGGSESPAPVRMPLDPELAATMRAASNPAPAGRAAVKPAETPVAKTNAPASAERANERSQT